MPGKRTTMRKLRDVLRLRHAAGLSIRDISRSTKLSVGGIQKLLSRAQALHLSWPLPAALDDTRLAQLFYPGADTGSSRRHQLPDWPAVHQELKRPYVTKQLLWEEYTQRYPSRCYSYSQFCDRYRHWCGQQRRTLRQSHKAGEKCFVDYSGSTVPVIDTDTGEVRQAQLFVAVLGASNYTFAEATWTQSLPDWLGSHSRALTFFGGCPALIVPDNLRSGVNATWTQSLPDWLGSHSRALTFFGGCPALIVPDNLRSGVSAACRYDPHLRKRYPLWGKRKLWRVLMAYLHVCHPSGGTGRANRRSWRFVVREQDWRLSESTVGRIVARLVRLGRVEPELTSGLSYRTIKRLSVDTLDVPDLRSAVRVFRRIHEARYAGFMGHF